MFQLKSKLLLLNFISLTQLLSPRFYPSIHHLPSHQSINFNCLAISAGQQRKSNVSNTTMFPNRKNELLGKVTKIASLQRILQKDEAETSVEKGLGTS